MYAAAPPGSAVEWIPAARANGGHVIEAPQIVTTSAVRAAVLPLFVRRDAIQAEMDAGIRELTAAAQAQGIAIVGPPVDAPVAPAGRMTPGELPAATVARTIYTGPYESLGAGWHEFMDWIEAAGHTAGPHLWERYLTGPESPEPPELWRTELNRPLLG